MRISTGVLSVAIGGYAVVLAAKLALALQAKRRFPAPETVRQLELSVIQPILSGDPGLERTLGHNLAVLEDADFVWLVDAADTEGRRVVGRLQQRYPLAQIHLLLCPPAPPGVSPKSFKLGRATRGRPGTFLILDDDTRVTREGVGALVSALDRSDLATGLPQYGPGTGWASRILGQFVNNSSAFTYLALSAWAEPRSINGMTYALHSATLERLGGFAAIERELTDDLALARRVHALGGRIIQTPYPQLITTDVQGLRHYTALMHRWMRFTLVLLASEPTGVRAMITVLYGLPPLVLAGSIAAGVVRLWRGQPGALGAVAALLAVRALSLVIVQYRVAGAVQWRPVTSLTAELLTPLHLLHALLQPTIVWRGQRWTLHPDGTFVEAAQ